MRLSLLTYNIHKCVGGVDLRYKPERIAEVIAHEDPDIALLQEVAHPSRASRCHRQVDVLGELLAYRHRTWFPNWSQPFRGCYGNAILSRPPFTETSNIDLRISIKKRRSALHARYRVRVGSRTRTLHVFNLHLGLSGVERGMQIQRLLRAPSFARLHALTPIVIAGDFNDVYGSLGHRLLEPAGFHTLGRPHRTWPAIAPVRALDGVYVRGNIELEDVHLVRSKLTRAASDHLPLMARVVLR